MDHEHDHDGDPAPAADPAIGGFAALGLRGPLLEALEQLGYEEPTPIQREAIPHLLRGADLLGQAATGTGKTAAFALPALELVPQGKGTAPVALVLAPTRELAVQVNEAFFRYGKAIGARCVPVYGGQPIYRQLQALDRGADIVVGTPGRVIDHIGRGSLPLDSIRMVVLDEADEMLDMGFADDIESILEALPHAHQTVLFSATMPPRINAIASRHLKNPVRINVVRGDTKASTGKVKQIAYVVPRAHKPAALGRVLDIQSPGAALVFCRTRTEVDELTETMNARGYRAEALHGGMDQAQRDRVMGRLRDGTAELLVATDVAARGLDVDLLTHVVNYDVPSAPESYVHRIGRVGRAGREGVAITLAEPREQRLLSNIERLTRQPISIEKVPSVADLRAAQLEQTVEAVRESLSADDLEEFYPVLHALRSDADARSIALAAVRLYHEAVGNTVDEAEIPEVAQRAERRPRDERPTREHGSHGGHGNAATGFVWVGLGRDAGIRPADIVGCIANETDLEGRQIGPIRITDRYSVVGVPAERLDQVIEAVRNATLKGKRPNARAWSEQGDPRGPRTDGARPARRDDGPRRDGPRRDDGPRPKRPSGPTRGGRSR